MTIAAAASLKLKRLPCIFKSSSSLLFNIDNDNSSCQRLPISELNVENRNIEEVSIGKMIEKHDQQHILHLIRDFFVVYLVGILYVLKELVTPHRKLSKTDVRDKAGQTAIVTGGTRGIGLEIVRQLLAHGMHVIMASSNSVVGKESLRQLRVEFPNEKVEFHPLDLKSLASVKEFANHFLQRNIPLHLLINNAGVMFGPYSLTKDGFESQLGINYIGHFYLTYLLLPVLEKTGTSTEKTRIVNVSSCGHFTGRIKISDLNSSESYSTYGCYGQSKLAQIMQAKLFQEYFQKKNINITINAVHPGVVDTKLYQNTWFEFAPFITRSFFKSAKQGADGIVFVALSTSLEGVGGKYFENCKEAKPSKLSQDKIMQRRLWEETCKLIGIQDFLPPSL